MYNIIKSECLMFGAELIAVSKTKPVNEIMAIYNQGQRAFGENKPQEMLSKQPLLPADIEWHMIGGLQTNKVKSIISQVHLIHSVDRKKLMDVINEEGRKIERTVPVLLQISIAEEETKQGFQFEELVELLRTHAYSHLKICGVMGMATFTEDKKKVKQEFTMLQSYFDQLKQSFFNSNPDFNELSMGMSGDYKIALECGSTMVRVGSAIFGSR